MTKTNKKVCLLKWSIIIMAFLITVNDGYWFLDIGLITTDDMAVLNIDHTIMKAAWSITDVCLVEFLVTILCVVLCIIMLANSEYGPGAVTGMIVVISKLCFFVYYLIKGLAINQSLQNSTSELLIDSVVIKSVISITLAIMLSYSLWKQYKKHSAID